MERPLVEEDVRIQVVNVPRHHLPVGTKGTIWQAHENPRGERVGRVLWDNGVETPYFLERIPHDQLAVIYDEPPEWARLKIEEWRTHIDLRPAVAGPMRKLLRGFKILRRRDRRTGKGGPWG